MSDRQRLRIFCDNGHDYRRIANVFVDASGDVEVAYAAQVQDSERVTRVARFEFVVLETHLMWCASCRVKVDFVRASLEQVFQKLATAGVREVALRRVAAIVSSNR